MQLVLLVDVQSKLGPIQHMVDLILQAIADVNTKLILFLCVVVACAIGLGLLLPILLTHALVQLERGMVALALLNYPKNSSHSLIPTLSWFTEVATCQRSFLMLERLWLWFVASFGYGVVCFIVRTVDFHNLILSCIFMYLITIYTFYSFFLLLEKKHAQWH